MLAGARAFQAEDVSLTLAEVMKSEPDWTRLPPLPPLVQSFLKQCFRKDPRQRPQAIGDVRLVLEGAFETAAPHSPMPAGAAPRSIVARALPWAAAAVLFVTLGIALWAPWRAETPADRPLVRLDVDLGADVSLPAASNGQSSINISPDGTRLVYLSGTPRRLFTRRLDQPTATGKIHKISVEGGPVVPLAAVEVFTGATWAEDGSIFFGELAERKGLLQLAAAGGAPTLVASPGAGESFLSSPRLLPGGKALLFEAVVTATEGAWTTTIEVLTLADGRRKTVARGGRYINYLTSSKGKGHLLYLDKATLFAIPFDLETLETRGTAVPVLDDVAYVPSLTTGQFAVSRTGALIYRRSRGDAAAAMNTVQWVSPSAGSTGKQESLLVRPGAYQTPTLSPDGTRIALTITQGGDSDIWVYDPQRDAMTRLTFGGVNGFPVWSPAGQNVVFQRRSQGLYQARADGGSPPQALMERSNINQVPSSFTPDGKRLAYDEFVGSATNAQMWTVSLEDQGGQLKAGTPELFLKSNFSYLSPSFSPDGRWLAYQSDESGRVEVYVRAFPPPTAGQGSKWQVSNNAGNHPRWSRTGHELVYRSGNQLMTASYAVKGTTFVADKPRVWIATLGVDLDGNDWDLAPDGKRIAVVIPEGSAQAPQAEHVIVMLLNFADELRRRVPLGK